MGFHLTWSGPSLALQCPPGAPLSFFLYRWKMSGLAGRKTHLCVNTSVLFTIYLHTFSNCFLLCALLFLLAGSHISQSHNVGHASIVHCFLFHTSCVRLSCSTAFTVNEIRMQTACTVAEHGRRGGLFWTEQSPSTLFSSSHQLLVCTPALNKKGILNFCKQTRSVRKATLINGVRVASGR